MTVWTITIGTIEISLPSINQKMWRFIPLTCMYGMDQMKLSKALIYNLKKIKSPHWSDLPVAVNQRICVLWIEWMMGSQTRESQETSCIKESTSIQKKSMSSKCASVSAWFSNDQTLSVNRSMTTSPLLCDVMEKETKRNWMKQSKPAWNKPHFGIK